MLTLAQLLGYNHSDPMLDDLTARQLEDWLLWMHYYHPFPDRDDFLRSALVAIANNAWLDGDKLTPNQVNPHYRGDPEDDEYPDITAEEMGEKLRWLLSGA